LNGRNDCQVVLVHQLSLLTIAMQVVFHPLPFWLVFPQTEDRIP
jgi:hypothetical protein